MMSAQVTKSIPLEGEGGWYLHVLIYIVEGNQKIIDNVKPFHRFSTTEYDVFAESRNEVGDGCSNK